MSGDTTRDLVELVADDLDLVLSGEFDGQHLDERTVGALVAFFRDLCAMHDETAIDLETWPTASAFVHAYLFEED